MTDLWKELEQDPVHQVQIEALQAIRIDPNQPVGQRQDDPLQPFPPDDSDRLSAEDLLLPMEVDLGHWGNLIWRIWMDENPERIIELRQRNELVRELLRINQILSDEQLRMRERLQWRYIGNQRLKAATRLVLENQITQMVNQHMQTHILAFVGDEN